MVAPRCPQGACGTSDGHPACQLLAERSTARQRDWSDDRRLGRAGRAYLRHPGRVVAVLSLERHPDCDKISMIRGLLLMGLGFVLNLLTPHWFSPHSFFSMSRPCLADHPHRPCGRDPRIGGLLQILATLFPVSKPHGHNRGSSIFRPNLCALA